MADRYWVGGSGTWNSISTSNWSTTSGGASGASAPTGGDNVFFDGNSDSGSDFTVTVTTSNTPSCDNLTVSGLNYNVIFTSSQSSFIAISIYGNFTLPNKLSTPNATWNVQAITAFRGSGTITTNGTALGIDGYGKISISVSSRTLGSDLTVEAGELSFSQGTFDTAGYDIYTTYADFIISGTSTRTLNLNSSDINLGNGKDWDATTTTNLTFNPGTSTIKLRSGTFNGGGLTYYNLECRGNNAFVNQSNTFNNLIFTNNYSTKGLNSSTFSDNQTVTGSISSSSTDATYRSFVKSNTLGTQRTLTCAAVSSLTDVDFRDIVIDGAAAPATGTRLGNCGNNSGITFTTAANKYWVGASSADWNSTSWATSSGGAASDNNFPLPQDTAIIDDLALTAGETVTLNAAYNYPTIDTSARTNAMTLSLSQNSTIVGGLLVGSGVTISGDYFVFTNNSLQQLSGSLPRLYIDGFSSGGVELAAAVSATSRVDLVNGTLDLSGYTLTTPTFETLAGTKDITFNGGTIDITGGFSSWDISIANYIQEFSVSAQATIPYSMFFKPDGTKMYVLDYSSDKVYQYNLSTPWNISTASYSGINFSVVTQESTPTGLFFKPDGTKMYVLGDSGNDVNEYNLSTAWDVSTASYLQNKGVAATSPGGIFFKPDGTKMYVVDSQSDVVVEYNLSSAWDISTASYFTAKVVSAEDTVPRGIFFKPDGTKMYITGAVNDSVYEYDLSTPWVVNTASYLQAFYVGTQQSSPYGLSFKPDGTKMYIVGFGGSEVTEYNLLEENAWLNSNPTGFTTTAGSGTGSISMTSADFKIFTGGASTYNCVINQGGAGTLIIYDSNTFDDITNTYAGASTISLNANQTVSNFTLSGTSGNVITFNSFSYEQQDISKSSGLVVVNYLDIAYSNATGGATWYAFTANGNVDGGNNDGWDFVPPTSGSMFMMFG